MGRRPISVRKLESRMLVEMGKAPGRGRGNFAVFAVIFPPVRAVLLELISCQLIPVEAVQDDVGGVWPPC